MKQKKIYTVCGGILGSQTTEQWTALQRAMDTDSWRLEDHATPEVVLDYAAVIIGVHKYDHVPVAVKLNFKSSAEARVRGVRGRRAS